MSRCIIIIENVFYIRQVMLMTVKNSDAVTINDVAKKAGVSITTVSRVLNNNYPVKQETREKIEAAIKELEYVPNEIARGLITKKTSLIGVIVPGITNLFFPTIVEEIDRGLQKKGYKISLNNTFGNPDVERELVSKMLSLQVDGLIVIDPSSKNIKSGFYTQMSSQLPLIIVSPSENSDGINTVSYDETIGTVQAFKYLEELGHKKIAFIRGKKSYSYDLKEKIYEDFQTSRGDVYKNIISIEHGNTLDAASEAEKEVSKLIGSDACPSAIFACNDVMAIGAINACVSRGINVPGDISIVGFDNTFIASVSAPKLTTVDMKMASVGKSAADSMLKVIENENLHINIIIKTELIVRDSCRKI